MATKPPHMLEVEELESAMAKALAKKIKDDWMPNDIRYQVEAKYTSNDQWRIYLTFEYDTDIVLHYDFCDLATPSHSAYMGIQCAVDSFTKGLAIGKLQTQKQVINSISKGLFGFAQ